ncbi:hypothetical protein [Nocardiopsis sp. NPDC058789]|uniref:hypothetical protein n=1 Tax=Nocardiopsis sp. NPDC058789 TaxID=3346634 RepID=UPI00366CC3BA
MSAPPTRVHSRLPLAPFWAALAWSAVALGLALGWLAGVVPPGLSEAEAFGTLHTAGNVGVTTAVSCVVGAVGVALALLLPRGTAPRLLESLTWALVAVLLLFYVESTLLVWLGYSLIMPVVVWAEPALGAAYVAHTLSPGLLHVLFFALGAGIWVWAALAHRRGRRQGCARCGRAPAWTPELERSLRGRALRVGRVAVACAFVLALLYPALRLPWLFGYSMGLPAERFAQISADPGAIMVGVGLGSAGVAGAVLMLGLVQRWGVRFPRWTVGLSGRRVPVSLAVLPAGLVAMALLGLGRGVLVRTWQMGGIVPGEETHTFVFGSMPLWAVALAVATVAYAVRRRAECGVCGRGLPETWPVPVPARPRARSGSPVG